MIFASRSVLVITNDTIYGMNATVTQAIQYILKHRNAWPSTRCDLRALQQINE